MSFKIKTSLATCYNKHSFKSDEEMSLQEAKDPNTPISRLLALWREQNPQILRALAQNPGTPVDKLLILAQRYPAEFLENPVLPLLLLENPNVLHACPGEVFLALLAIPTCPHWVFPSLASHPDLDARRDVAWDVNTPIPLLEMLASDVDREVRRGVAVNGKTPRVIVDTLSMDADQTVRKIAEERLREG
jgi:hypothetical protein